MTARRPIVLINGGLRELPVGDAMAGALPLWWILPDETVSIPARAQYVVHGDLRCEGEIRVGLNAQLRVTA